jgi:hypothetical protein
MKILKILLILIIALFLSTSVSAIDEWTETDNALQITYSFLQIIDGVQTYQKLKHPDRFEETNPILGKHPSKDDLILYNFSCLILHGIVSYCLPKKYRRSWQIITIGMEIHCIEYNYHF